MFIDTHTHLYLEDFDNDIDAVMKRAAEVGVDKFFLPNIDSTSVNVLHELCKKYPAQCFPMMGLHPCSVKENYLKELDITQNLLRSNKYYAVGEIGIDLYWDKTTLPQQIEAFEKQIQWALDLHLPIVIHCRDAFDEIYDVLTKFKTLPKGIFHCFTGSTEQAEKIIALKNFKLGIGGVITFKNSGLDKTIEQIDLKHLVLETDSPYLTPAPYRGQRNESSYLRIIAKRIAEVKNCNMGHVAEITTKNAIEIFGETH
ncbi:MAG TPA: TatD family hydrolase [Bacteroidia bacterium]|jgi:TatD DNase family protein|nr:TatD family hydrolase [Bacteroidia bacterium]